MKTQYAQAGDRLHATPYAFQLGFDGVAFLSPESALKEFRRHCRASPTADDWNNYQAGAAAAETERAELQMSPERYRDYQASKEDNDDQEGNAVQP